MLILAMPPRSAHAQLTRLPAVAVLDFGVLGKSKYTDILGRSATDAVVIEMTRSGRYDVAARTLVNQQLQELGMRTPSTNNDIRRLGTALGVDSIVSGDVQDVSFTDKPRRARVTLSVRFTDVVSGELVNGAIQSGFSGAPAPGMSLDDETMINQALTDAAANIVRTINNYTLPEATVLLNSTRDEVTLNRGSRDGLQPGQEMIVVRGRDRVGKIRITFVESTTSVASILDYGKGIRPEDKARAIFVLPGYSVSENGVINSSATEVKTYRPSQNRITPILITALAIGAAVLLATFLFSSKSTTTEATGISKVEARAFAIGSAPNAVSDASSRVQVSWRAAPDIPINNILEYHIYRDYRIIGVTVRQNTQFIDDPTLPTGATVTYSQVFYTQTSGPIGSTTTGTTTGTGNNTGGNTTGNTNGNNNTGNGTGNNTGPAQQPQLATVTEPVTPLTTGITHRYQITIVYQAVQAVTTGNAGGVGTGTTGGGGIGGNTGGGGIGGGGAVGGTTSGTTTTGGGNGTNGGNNTNGTSVIYRETALRASSGAATPVVRPSINGVDLQGANTGGQSSSASLKTVAVNFQTVSGADQYVFEFAKDPGFKNKVVKGPFYFPSANTTAASDPFDLRSGFQDVPLGQFIFFRVGARNSLDQPGPLGQDTPNGGNYIYSADLRTFQNPGVPPPPPGS